MCATVLIGLALAFGCATPEPSLRQAEIAQPSRSSQMLAGSRAAPDLEARQGGIWPDRRAERRLERIGQRLTRGTEPALDGCRYQVLFSSAPNAFSLPGRVYVTRGLYTRLDRDALLAAALAHEMAHILRSDSFKPRCTTMEQALHREQQADVLAAQLLDRADYPPEAMRQLIRLIRNDQPAGWAEARIALLRRTRLQAALPTSRP